MSSIPESKVDVLILGAGPAGVMCANGLAKAGVNVRIIDKRPSTLAAGQADGIQPRTIEVLQSYGLADALISQAAQLHMAAFYNPAPNGGIECTGRAPDVTAPTARFPFELTLHQGAIEKVFLDSMRQEGLEVERPKIPTSLEISTDEAALSDPHAYAVKVVLKSLDVADGADDTEIVHAKYVLGSDGAHSWVRKTLGINMDGEQTEYIWGVIDMVPSPETNFPDYRNRCAIHSENGSCMIIPREGDKIRLYLQLTNADVVDPATGRVDMNRFGPDKLLEVAKKSFYPYIMTTTLEKIDWWTIYIIGQRVASKFSVNERVFIAGDACHTHSPKAGQGMNASMNDTHNLIWKLTHVLRGWADLSLLKTYEFERRKYAQDLIAFDKKFSALFSGKPKSEEYADGVTHEEFLQAFQAFGAFTSGIGIHYAQSALTSTTHQAAASNLIIGQRILPQVVLRMADRRAIDIQDVCPADTRFKVLVFTGDLRDPAQRARVEKFAAELGRKDGFFRAIGETKAESIYDVLSILKGKKEEGSHFDVPEILRVLLDDTDVTNKKGGKVYETYGVGPEGAVVVVRPDGYVGTVAPLDQVKTLDGYFAEFMRSN
ncbi:hypothetical protein HETIRDRAFT_459911 [Heterobasidion irregulare TC 32-1]|uniref:FAD-binding domain-containing protein n=1 Tax=Heterobasidion irregulare (strain TC 32-1) TaxID=747525 RepID=W4JZ09_HETIT|nr:uncharacterized protein HETIRDRAFT_459911 [Heterobasidion irregulare TC 32-1]ETW78714.1 hypothetical protein HETIRDRAFT_459911 [Heterobasidion irregulare TC 32-1]